MVSSFGFWLWPFGRNVVQGMNPEPQHLTRKS
jgi:hypothetical protein